MPLIVIFTLVKKIWQAVIARQGQLIELTKLVWNRFQDWGIRLSPQNTRLKKIAAVSLGKEHSCGHTKGSGIGDYLVCVGWVHWWLVCHAS